VLVKNQSSAVVDMSNPDYTDPPTGNGKFKVQLDYKMLMKPDRAPQYWIEPAKENITINLKNVQSIRNQNLTVNPNPFGNGTLTAIRIEYTGRHIDGTERSGDLPIPVEGVYIDGNLTPVTFDWPGDSTDDRTVNSSVDITLPAGFFIPLSTIANVTINKMNVSYAFDPDTVNLSQDKNIYYYDSYDKDGNDNVGFSPPTLTPAILEVRVW
jgi:hypothetical protein